MKSWDAAVVIQAFGRRVIARQAFLDHLNEKRNRIYRDLLAAAQHRAIANDDVIAEARTQESEHPCDEIVEAKDPEPSDFFNLSEPQPDDYVQNNLVDSEDIKCVVEEIAKATVAPRPEHHYSEIITVETVNATVHKPDPPMFTGTIQPTTMPHVPKRNAIAKVACKFDDALTKAVANVKDMVTCSSNANNFEGALEIGKDYYKSAPAKATGRTPVDAESNRRAALTQIMYRTRLGWKIANNSCSECKMPLMMRPGDVKLTCVVCDESDPVSRANGGSSVASHQPFNAYWPTPLHVNDKILSATSHQTFSAAHNNSMTSVVSHQPFNAAYNPAHTMQVRANRISSRQPLNTQMNTANINSSGSVRSGNSVMRGQLLTMQADNYLRSNWIKLKHGCPRCNSPLMRDLSKNMDHCRQCGPVAFNLNPSQSNFSTSASSANEGSGLRPKEDTSSASLLDADCNDDVSVDQQSVLSNAFAGAQARKHGWNYTRTTP
eukprot:scaffold13573_cov198-Alexandrium_tamarense.AAC.1